MNRKRAVIAKTGPVIGCLLLAGLLTQAGSHEISQAAIKEKDKKSEIKARMTRVPLHFEENRGQSDKKVRFVARGNRFVTFLTDKEAVFSVTPPTPRPAGPGDPVAKPSVVRMGVVGATGESRVTGHSKVQAKTNYFIGSDSSKWLTDVPNFTRVKYDEVLPGVDMVYYGRQNCLEYDMVVAPGTDPRTIRVSFSGQTNATINQAGDLVLATTATEIVQGKPVAYQVDESGRRQPVEARYALAGASQEKALVGFELGEYDHSRELVIDPPVMLYGTFVGGSEFDVANEIVADASGNAYVTGTTQSGNFPTVPGGQPFQELWVAKYDDDGDLVYTALLGGSTQDYSGGLAVTQAGEVIVCGTTQSNGSIPSNAGAYPTTAGAYQRELGGSWDAVISKLNVAGNTLLYSTYVGSTNDDKGLAVATDSTGQLAYLTGRTWTNGGAFPFITASLNGYDTTNFWYDAYLVKLTLDSSQGTAHATSYPGVFHDKTDLLYSTFIGGSDVEGVASLLDVVDLGVAVAANDAGIVSVAGDTYSSDFPTSPGAFQTTKPGGAGTADGFVVQIDTTLTGAASRLWSTYLGGGGTDYCLGIGMDADLNVYVTGITDSDGSPGIAFPTNNAVYGTYRGGTSDVFVSKINSAGTGLIYSTFLGGAGAETGAQIRVDGIGNAYIVGTSSSSGYPFVQNANVQPGGYQGNSDMFITKLRPSGTGPIFSTFLGGVAFEAATGISVDAAGNAYVSGYTSSPLFPTLNAQQPSYGGGSWDGIVAKFQLNDAPEITSALPDNETLDCEDAPEEFTWTVDVLDINSDDLKVKWYTKGPGDPDFTLIETDDVFGPAVDLGPPILIEDTVGSASFTEQFSEVGVTTVRVVVEDGLASDTQEWTVTITDDEGPTIDGLLSGSLPTRHLAPTNDPACDRFEGDLPLPALLDCDPDPTITGSIPDPDGGANNGAAEDDLTEFPISISEGDQYIEIAVGETFVVTWTATDWVGNMSTVTEELVVEDVVAPVLTIPDDVTLPSDVELGATLTAQELGILDGSDAPLYNAVDACGTSFIVAFRDNPWNPGDGDDDDGIPANLDGFYPLGNSRITWIAYDEAFNFVELYQNVYIEGSTTIESPLTSDDEDWTVYGVDVSNAQHSATGGNPDGYISASQPAASSELWYFEAPSSYHGNQQAALGQALSFDLKVDGAVDVSSDLGVIIAGGGLQIYAPLGSAPNTTWATKAILLSTAGGWKVDDGDGNLGNDVLATDDQIETTLGSVISLKIGGKFRSAAGATTSLDNPSLALNYDNTP